MDKFHDSAGVPWEGREFSLNQFSSDDGSTPEAVARALSEENFSLAILHESLMQSRLLIPLVAQLGDSEVGAHGQLVDNQLFPRSHRFHTCSFGKARQGQFQ